MKPIANTFADIDWTVWKPKEIGVLCFIRPTENPDQILLIEKKRGLGAGKINGPGGRVDPGESPLEAAIRETQEEVHLTPMSPTLIGILGFQFTDGYSLRCHVFLAKDYKGQMQETDEAKPFWQPIAHIPYSQMWADDYHWFPHLLAEEFFIGNFVFDDDHMLTKEIQIVKQLPVF